MTPEQQQVAIAEACGWRMGDLRPSWCHPDNWSMAKSGSYEVWVSQDKLPDYLKDLNAMHEAEKVLTSEQVTSYVDSLESMNERWSTPAFATASQRAEAFLRAIGKWEEAKP